MEGEMKTKELIEQLWLFYDRAVYYAFMTNLNYYRGMMDEVVKRLEQYEKMKEGMESGQNKNEV
jgi:hypothetical protein